MVHLAELQFQCVRVDHEIRFPWRLKIVHGLIYRIPTAGSGIINGNDEIGVIDHTGQRIFYGARKRRSVRGNFFSSNNGVSNGVRTFAACFIRRWRNLVGNRNCGAVRFSYIGFIYIYKKNRLYVYLNNSCTNGNIYEKDVLGRLFLFAWIF